MFYGGDSLKSLTAYEVISEDGGKDYYFNYHSAKHLKGVSNSLQTVQVELLVVPGFSGD